MPITNLPGGRIVSGFGGYVTINRLGDTPIRVDVGSWMLENIHINEECPHTGSLGAITRRRVGLDWNATLNIWYNVDKGIEEYIRTGISVGITLYVGDLRSWLGYGKADQDRYVAPSGLLDTCTTLNDAVGVVRQTLTIMGNSLVYKLPNEAVPYAEYIAALEDLGEI